MCFSKLNLSDIKTALKHFNHGLQLVQHVGLLRYQLHRTGTIFLLTPRLTQEMEMELFRMKNFFVKFSESDKMKKVIFEKGQLYWSF